MPKTHCKSGTRTHNIWKSMRQRCNNPNSKCYKHYGGRGITVCERWNDYTNFLTDLGECPVGYSIERIDNDGNYCPENCHWIKKSKQPANRRPYTIKTETENLVGSKFGRLTVISMARTNNGRKAFQCLCDCGNVKVINCAHVKSGDIRSCGCVRRETTQKLHEKRNK